MWPFTSTAAAPSSAAAPAESASACPVDHETRSAWLQSNPVPDDAAHKNPLARRLSTLREVSSIPRYLAPTAPAQAGSGSPPPPAPSSSSSAAGEANACPMHEQNANSAEAAATVASEQNWVYPSPASFYTALERKQRNPRAQDMDIVVPIHNAVNERVWQQVLDWEREAMGLGPGEETGCRLVSFVGKPKQMSPRARWKSFIGYTAPFDRHDWIVDRPAHPPSRASLPASAPSPSALTPSPSASTPASAPPSDSPESVRVRYVIDFYTGRGRNLLAPPPDPAAASSSDPKPEEILRPNLAFFIDCRPALDGWEGVRMRFNKYWGLSPTPAEVATTPGTGRTA